MRKVATPGPDAKRALFVMLPDAVFVALADHATRQRETRATIVARALKQYLAQETRRATPCEAVS